MEKRIYPQLAEQAIWKKLPNGLPVVVIPKPGFSRCVAYFVTDYGSVHTAFSVNGKQMQAPAGTAHFLEHKLFDMPQRDIMAEFAAMGAMPNAFTSYDMTAYYFSCTENFVPCLRLLLEFVSSPYFTEESVRKEQGIIGQEIDMNEDAPDTRIFENLMKIMYREHPVKVPILGTRQTISQITPQTLDTCHKAFYCPENMLLCVVGDVDAQEVFSLAEQTLPAFERATVKRLRTWPEEMECLQKEICDSMEVAMPMFQIGFKCEPPEDGENAVRMEAVGDLAAEALFGESSPLYLRLYEGGLIDTSFGGGFETIEGMAMLTCSGDSEDPDAVRNAILARAEELVKEGLPQKEFLRMKRSALGRRVRDMDSFDSVAFRVCAYYFSKFDYFEFPAVYESVCADEILDFIKSVVTQSRCAMSVIRPLQREAEDES